MSSAGTYETKRMGVWNIYQLTHSHLGPKKIFGDNLIKI